MEVGGDGRGRSRRRWREIMDNLSDGSKRWRWRIRVGKDQEMNTDNGDGNKRWWRRAGRSRRRWKEIMEMGVGDGGGGDGWGRNRSRWREILEM